MSTVQKKEAQFAIEIDSVKTVLGSKTVHENVSFNVKKGQITALIAASGGGKSVLLREVLALSRPTAGRIRVLGVDVQQASQEDLLAIRNRVGVLFQNGALFSDMTVAENIAVPLKEHRDLEPSSIERIVTLRIAMVGLPATAATLMPSSLSGGMRKRAALARALALEPEMLFLDEPTSGLDPISARQFDELVKILCESLGITIFLVTHDPESLWSIAHQVVALADGKVIGQGSVKEVSHMAHPWLQEYFSIGGRRHDGVDSPRQDGASELDQGKAKSMEL